MLKFFTFEVQHVDVVVVQMHVSYQLDDHQSVMMLTMLRLY